ncbi:PHP domain-containing protein [Lachnospiraceae bacterium 62-35]
MENLYYDLHIHSCASPCGDDDMTPANIAGMAMIKGLDVIAVTDHNTCKNCQAVLAAAEEYGLTVVPGMEICTSEEVHAICLFSDLKGAMEFDSYIYDRLPDIPNRADIFGKQEVYSCEDEKCQDIHKLLINACSVSFEDLWDLTKGYDGVMFPAHIDKEANSLLYNLGFIPPDSQFGTAEVYDMKRLHGLKKRNSYLEGCRIISNSDAHYLPDIQEPQLTIPVRERSARAVVEALKGL